MDKLDMFEDASGNTGSTAAAAPAEQKGGRRNTRKNRRNATRKNRKNTRRNNGTARRNNMEMEGGAKVTVGSKAQVWHGTAKHTSGGLKKKDLMKHKGKIVSRRKHAAGLKAIKKLRKLGYTAKKGTFKLFKKQK